ncbi:MAG TPA: AI-2E family transporter [Steroidobacteraceae bacterium]|nr:AI-2E family transporter [Steroidobacteraceae bacterium]
MSVRLSTSTVVLIIAAAVFLYLIRPILLPFVVPLVLAFLLDPLIVRISRTARAPRAVVATAIFLVLLAVAGVIAWLIFPVITQQARSLGSNLQGTIESMANTLLHGRELHFFGRSLTAAELAKSLMDALHSAIPSGAGLVQVATVGAGALLGTLLSIVLLAYFLIDGPRIVRGALGLVPPERRPFITRVTTEVDPILRRYFIGVALVVVYAACAAYVGLGPILGIHHAVVLAILTGVLELIPLIGPAAAAVIVGLLATQQAKSAWDIVAFALYAFALRISIDQLFGPLVLGKAACLSPVVVIFCFLAGGLLFGIVGVILAVPVALVIRTTLAVLYDEPHGR